MPRFFVTDQLFSEKLKEKPLILWRIYLRRKYCVFGYIWVIFEKFCLLPQEALQTLTL